jgi:hypothetical protein
MNWIEHILGEVPHGLVCWNLVLCPKTISGRLPGLWYWMEHSTRYYFQSSCFWNKYASVELGSLFSFAFLQM